MMQRIRLEIAEELLPPGLATGLGHRTWFWPSPAATCVAAFTQEVFARFQLHCPSGPAGLQLLLSGFTLPPDAPIGILRDGDLLVVQRLAVGAAGALTHGTPKAVPKPASIKARVPGPSGGGAAGTASGAVATTVSGKKRKSAAVAGAAGAADGTAQVATPQPGVEHGQSALEENGAAPQPVDAAVGAAEASPDAAMAEMLATGGTDKAKGPSRSARRKAAKRRLKRTGVLPYGDAAARAGSKAAPASQLQGGGAAGAPPAKKQRQDLQPQPQPQHAAQGKAMARAPPASNGTAGLLAAAMAASPLDPNGVLLQSQQPQQQQQLPVRQLQTRGRGSSGAGPSTGGAATRPVALQAAAGTRSAQNGVVAAKSKGGQSSDNSSEVSEETSGDSSASSSSSEEEESGTSTSDESSTTSSSEGSSSSEEESSEDSSDESSDSEESGSDEEDQHARKAAASKAKAGAATAAPVAKPTPAKRQATRGTSNGPAAAGVAPKGRPPPPPPPPPPAAPTAPAAAAAPAVIDCNYEALPTAVGPVPVGAVLAYKLLEIGADMCPRVSSWRMGKVTAWDGAEAVVTLQPHPDAHAHPLQAELDALKARLSAEAEADLEDEDHERGKASSSAEVELDWGSLPFPTEYHEDGTLAMPLAGFADVRAVSLPTGAKVAPAAAGGAPRTAAASGPAAATSTAQPSRAAGILPSPVNLGPPRPSSAAQVPMRGLHGGAAGVARPPPAISRTTAATPGGGATPRGPPPGAPPPGAVVAAVGGWADLAEQLRRRRQELASPGGGDISPGGPPGSGVAAAGGGPPAPPEVSVPAFTPKGRMPPQRQGAASVGPPAGGSDVPSSAGASPAQADGEGSRPSGVQTRGAVRPRGGVRRIALGPMLNHLRQSGEL